MMTSLPKEFGGIESIKKRYSQAVERRIMWSTLYRECYRYAIPSRQLFEEFAPGQEKENELFDSTATQSVLEFASRLQATICPAWRNWSILEPGPNLAPEQRESTEIIGGLEKQTQLLFSYLNHSNFTLKSHEAFIDLAVGTGAICEQLNESMDGLNFECVPIARLAIEEGPYGLVETVFEDKRLPIRSILRLYGGQVALPTSWLREKDYVEKSFVQSVIFEPKSRNYWLVLFSPEDKALMYARNMGPSSPYIVFRWSVVPGEVFGRGPVVNALADIRTLNKVVEYVLRGAALNLAPPMTGVFDGVLNPFTAVIAPDTIIPVQSNDSGNPSLRPLLTTIRMDLGQFILEDMRQQVRKTLLSDPRSQQGPVKTASEILIQDREFVQQIGSAFGRVQAEFVERVVARSVYLLQSIGAMAKIKVDGKEVVLKHTSPLARAQDTEDLGNLSNAVQLASAAAGPEAYQLSVKTDEISAYVFKKAGIPAELIRTSDERDEKMTQIRDAMQQQMAAQNPEPVPQAA